MIKCIAVDDEPLALGLLQDNISKLPYLELVAACEDAFEATRALQEQQVDLVFIDIQMPGLSGLQFIESLAIKPMIILVTAYKQYALDSYNLDVVDYLVKPVALDRFIKACNKAQQLYQLKNAKPVEQKSNPGYFFLNVDYSMLKVNFADIVWIEGLRDYIKIHLTGNVKPIVVRMSVKAIAEQLPETDFIRIHKSYIVSLNNITAIKKTSVLIKELELPVGETYRDVISNLTERPGGGS